MEAIKIEVTGNIAKVIEKPLRITSGTVGLPVEFVFDSHWDNMTKVAVFNTGIVIKNMKIVDNATVVPIEALAVPGLNLSIGVYGVSEDGAVATPTVWASVGQIRHGAVPGSSFGSDIGTAKKYYDLGEQAAEKADASAKKAEEAAGRAESAGGGAGNAVLYTPQSPTPAKQVQAKENIGASTFYHTTREKVGAEHDDINTKYIYGLYDALAAEYNTYALDKDGNPILDKNGKKIPIVRVQKNPLLEVKDEKDNVIANESIYEYVISTGDYSDANGVYQIRDGYDDIKKPKYLVMSGIDGHERKTVFSTYRFVRDVLRGHNVPQSFKEGAILHVLPVGCPEGFNNYTNLKKNGVYIEDNFDCEWVLSDKSGAIPASEDETKAITKWLNDNADADLFISYHNSGATNEIVAILGDSGNKASDMAKKIALKGVSRVIPFWRYVIGYPDMVEAKGLTDTDGDGSKVELRDVIYSYSANTRNGGTSILYAQEKLGIPSFGIETPSYYGSYNDWIANDTTYQPEPIAAGAEALGNILLEFYAQSVVSTPDVGTPIYNGEALLNIDIKTHAKFIWEE